VAVLRRFPSDSRTKADADAVGQLAESQDGVVGRQQLQRNGLSGTMIARWLQAGRLHRIHPHVYALGHRALSLRGRLWAALLYAGPDAVFSHSTAAWLWSLIDAEPKRIHITVPGRRRSLPEVRVHHSRQVAALHCRGFRVTSVARTLVDFGTMIGSRQLRRALAEADFRGLLDTREVDAVLKRGRPGSKALRAALQSHMPQLAKTLSLLEQRFLEVCESAGLQLPEINARIGRMRVDAIWRDQMLAVELDGTAAHSGPAAMKRDRRRELALRDEGFRVVRYSWDQVTRQSREVAADLRRLLAL
jgi:predicted transcriptional regulator of viral defense system